MTAQFVRNITLPNVITIRLLLGTMAECRCVWFSSEWFRSLVVISCPVELLLFEKIHITQLSSSHFYRIAEQKGGGSFKALFTLTATTTTAMEEWVTLVSVGVFTWRPAAKGTSTYRFQYNPFFPLPLSQSV